MTDFKQQPSIQKYKASGMKAQKNYVNEADDATLYADIAADWEAYNHAENNVDASTLHRMKQKIDEAIMPQGAIGKVKSISTNTPLKVLLSVAASLLLLLGYAVYWFYNDKYRALGNPVCVATAMGECASVSMPDGSKVTMNQNTALYYQARQYEGKERMIDFCGEGYFEVVSNPENPFVVNTDKVKVVVYGTKFNLAAQSGKNNTELTLEEGKLTLTADQLAQAAWKEHGWEVAGYWVAMVTRRSDELRLNKLKDNFEYRKVNAPITVATGFTATESVPVQGTWNDNLNYMPYPGVEVAKNPNLKR